MDDQTLELQIKSKSQEAVASVDKLIYSLINIESKINNISNSLNKTNNVSNFVNELNKATLSAKRLDKTDLSSFKSKLNELYTVVSNFNKSLYSIDETSFQNISKMLKGIPTSIEKINKIDLKKAYGTFNSLTRILDPFLTKLQQSEVSLTNFVQIAQSLESSSKSIKTIEKNMDKVNKQTNKATVSMNKLGKALSFSGLYLSLNRLIKKFLEWQNLSIDRTEQMNLFNVVFKNIEKNGVQTFSTLGKEATQFQYKLKEAFGTNMTETLKYQALFKSMGDNVGIPEQYSTLMSETMAKFIYDLASLYNKSENNTAEALRAGIYAGQTKPLRNYGIDVTQTSMQPILDELGIDKQVNQLSQAEKEILRYIAALRQGQVAMGDFANTIESPSNQLKILEQQLVEAKVNLTSLFIGSFQKILPYANALLMVVSEVSKAIADMFGIELSDYNSGIASQEDAYEDLEDQIDGTTQAAKELKRQTFGFDEIHNIDENKDNGSGEITGGIDKRLLEAITGYDNGMDKVRMKAIEIRDRIMEWLGFHKEIDPLTGETIFKLNNGKTIFKTIWDWLEKIWGIGKWFFNNIGTILGAFIAYKTIKTLTSVYDTASNLFHLVAQNKALRIALTFVLGYEGGKQLYNLFSALIGDGRSFDETWAETAKLKEYGDNVLERKKVERSQNLGDIIKEYGINSDEYNQQVKYLKEIYSPKNDPLTAKKRKEVLDFILENGNYFAETSGNSFIGDDNGVNIETYSDALKKYFDTYLDGVTSLNKYTEAVNASQTAHENACVSVAVLAEAITKPDYKITKEDMDNLTQSLTEMEESVQKKGQDTVTAIDKITQKYVERGFMSKEEADQIVRDAERIKLAEEGHTKEYIDAVTELQKKLDSGKISQSKFKEELVKLDKKYNDSSTIVGSFVDKLDIQKATLDLSAKNMNSIETSVKDMATAHEEAANVIQSSANNNRKVLEQYAIDCKKIYGEDSEEYALAVKSIKASDDERTQSIADVDEAYKNYLLNIVANMYESGDLMSDDAIETKNVINEELKKLGVDIDLSKNMSEIAKQLEMNGFKVGSGITFDENNIIVKTHDWFSKYTSWLQNSFDKKPIELTMNGNVKNITFGQGVLNTLNSVKKALGFQDGGAFYNGSWHNIQQYASGGVPSHGTLFVGGENGPEIAGHINGRTEILNQSQLASVMFSAVVNGMAQVMSQFANNSGQDIRVYAEEGIIVEKVAKGFEEHVKQTGTLPFTIP